MTKPFISSTGKLISAFSFLFLTSGIWTPQTACAQTLLFPDEFQRLPDSNPGAAVSANVLPGSKGKTFYGSIGSDNVVWVDGEPEKLDFPGTILETNSDFSYVKGVITENQRYYVFEDGNYTYIDINPPSEFSNMNVVYVSDDGSVIIGNARKSDGSYFRTRAVKITNGNWQVIGDDPPLSEFGSSGVGAVRGENGSIIIGDRYFGGVSQGFRLENGTFNYFSHQSLIYASTASPDGNVIAGNAAVAEANNYLPYVWKSGSLTVLGSLEGNYGYHFCTSANNEGSIVSGYAEVQGSGYRGDMAFIWIEGRGLIMYNDYIFEEYGITLPGERIIRADLSEDQSYISGTVGYADDRERSFILLLNVVKLKVEVLPEDERFDVDDLVPITLTVTNTTGDPVTIAFDTPVVLADQEGYLAFEPDLAMAPFTLDVDNPRKEIVVPSIALKRGIVELFSSAVATGPDGVEQILVASVEVPINPMSIEIKITPEQTVQNATPDTKKAEAALLYEAERPEDAIWTDCIEISATIKNEMEVTIENANVPGAENVLSMIKSLDLEEPGVPLEILGLVSSAGLDDAGQPVTTTDLAPGEALTLKWYVGVTTAPRPLEFKLLALGGINGRTARSLAEKEFKLIDKVLLKWGVRPRQNRTQYISGQNVLTEGFIENVSKEAGEEKDLLVMLFQMPKGNVGGGYMVEAGENPGEAGAVEPEKYQFFLVPPEGENRMDLVSLFRSMETDKHSTGKIAYDVRLWTIEEDDVLVPADGQALIEEDGWGDAFDVTFSPQPLPDRSALVDDCLRAGVPAWLCGASEGVYNKLGAGLADLAIAGVDLAAETKNHSVLALAHVTETMVDLWEAIQGDEAAKQAFAQEIYVIYQTYVELGVMAGEAGSNTPMAIEQFSELAVDTFNQFMFSLETGTVEERQLIIGEFFGSNPDLLLEPLIALRGFGAMQRALREIAAESSGNVIAATLKQEAERKALSTAQRVNAAFAAGTDAAKALRAGDKLTDAMMLKIYGITKKQLESLQRIAEQFGVVMTFRSRNPLSVELIESGAARFKPQALKHKTVNEIDMEFLGYPRDAHAKLFIVEPPKSLQGIKDETQLKEAIEAYVKKLEEAHPKLKDNDVLRSEVSKRLETRVEEWEELVPKNAETGEVALTYEIEVAFDAQAQFASKAGDTINFNDKRTVRQQPVEVHVDPVTGEARRRFQLDTTGPASEGAQASVFKPITGDVDFLAILEPNGMMIEGAQRRIDIYEALASELGIQHGESYTLFLQGAREKYLRCCVAGAPDAEAMVAIGPGARRDPTAAYFVDNSSVMREGPNQRFLGPRNPLRDKYNRVVRKKGQPVLIRREDVSGEFILLDGFPQTHAVDLQFLSYFQPKVYRQVLADAIRRFKFYAPTYIARLLLGEEPESEPGDFVSAFSAQKPMYDLQVPLFATGGPILQIDQDAGLSSLRVWTETLGWRSVSAAEALALGEPGTVDLAPMAPLAEAAKAGDTVVQILSLAELGAEGRFFEVGDRIVIDPGQPNQEQSVIVGLEPLTLSGPLVLAHAEGSMIAFLESGAVDSDGDGLADHIEFSLATDPNADDTDGDGLSDHQEVVYGTDPLDPGSRFEFAAVTTHGDGKSATVSWEATSGKTYTLERSFSLKTWFPVETVTATDDTILQIALDYATDEGAPQFFRLRPGN